MQEIPQPEPAGAAGCLSASAEVEKSMGSKLPVVPAEPKNGQVPGEFDLQEAEKFISRRAVELVRLEFSSHLAGVVENGRRGPSAGRRGRRNGFVYCGSLQGKIPGTAQTPARTGRTAWVIIAN